MPCSSDGQRDSLAGFVQHTERGRRFESGHGNNKTKIHKITMTIEEKEIRADFERFIRHEAMRANVSQDEIKKILGLQ